MSTSAAHDRVSQSYLDAGVLGYIRKTARKELYRFNGFALEDLIQEGMFCYCKVWNRYVRDGGDKFGKLTDTPNPTPEQRKHFMELFKTTLHNHLATLAYKNQYNVEIPISSLQRADQSEEAAWETLMPVEAETATVSTLLATAPSEVKQLFQLLISDAVFSPNRRAGKRGKFRPRETTNRYYCRLLGLPLGTDIVGMVNRHFGVT